MDLVVLLNGGLPIDLVRDEPPIAGFLARLATFSRVITFDPRGFGSSGRVDPDRVPAIQTWMDDLGTVMKAAGSDRASILSWTEPSLAVMLFAATYPDRVANLVLANAYARYLRNDECPWGMPAETFADYVQLLRDLWGTGEITRYLAPSLVTSEEARQRWARIERLSGTPDVAAVPQAFMESDITQVLPLIQAPTLLIARLENPHVRAEHSRDLAQRIPGRGSSRYRARYDLIALWCLPGATRRDRGVPNRLPSGTGPRAPAGVCALHRYRRVHEKSRNVRRPCVARDPRSVRHHDPWLVGPLPRRLCQLDRGRHTCHLRRAGSGD